MPGKHLPVSMQVLLSGPKLYIASTFGQTHLRRAAVGERRQMCEQPPLCTAHALSATSATTTMSSHTHKSKDRNKTGNCKLWRENVL